jgi:Aminoglycoside-2''-adenylyltransferase
MEEQALAQLRVIHLVVNTLRAADCSVWLFGGWGLDARIGRITRDHGDIEFWAASLTLIVSQTAPSR